MCVGPKLVVNLQINLLLTFNDRSIELFRSMINFHRVKVGLLLKLGLFLTLGYGTPGSAVTRTSVFCAYLFYHAI